MIATTRKTQEMFKQFLSEYKPQLEKALDAIQKLLEFLSIIGLCVEIKSQVNACRDTIVNRSNRQNLSTRFFNTAKYQAHQKENLLLLKYCVCLTNN